jgi:HSP20 family protein
MPPASTLEVKQSAEATPPALKLVPPADLFKRAEQLYDQVARRAFELFESKGRALGHEFDDWFRAESELLHPAHIDIAEAGNDLKVRAEVPGFTAKELDVSLEPRRLTISGKHETKQERKEEKTLYKESCSNQVLRVVDLPLAVDPEKATATLKDGILELTVAKAPPPKKLQVATKAG